MRREDGNSSSLLVSAHGYFDEIVTDAFERRKLKTLPIVKGYLVELLQTYIPAENLFDETDSSGRRVRQTLAETLLKAQSSDTLVKIELLKKLGDRSLYISGFFADSLQRKLVDVDYYADMGCTAYGALADVVREDTTARVYREFSRRFLQFADVLTDISSRSALTSEENLLRLYEIYTRTGSEVAREKLVEKGLVPSSETSPLKKQQ